MKVELMKQEVPIPEGVDVKVEERLVTIKGPKGENQRKFFGGKVEVTKEGNNVVISAKQATKREKTMIGTFTSHVRNMVKGTQEPFVYTLKICSGHFPMNVAVNGNQLVVKNFLGEKHPRTMDIIEGSTIKVQGQEITVESTDKEKAGQCAARIEILMKVKGRDRRIFQDGIYITNKAGKAIE